MGQENPCAIPAARSSRKLPFKGTESVTSVCALITVGYVARVFAALTIAEYTNELTPTEDSTSVAFVVKVTADQI